MTVSEDRMEMLEKPFVQFDVADLLFSVPGNCEIFGG